MAKKESRKTFLAVRFKCFPKSGGIRLSSEDVPTHYPFEFYFQFPVTRILKSSYEGDYGCSISMVGNDIKIYTDFYSVHPEIRIAITLKAVLQAIKETIVYSGEDRIIPKGKVEYTYDHNSGLRVFENADYEQFKLMISNLDTLDIIGRIMGYKRLYKAIEIMSNGDLMAMDINYISRNEMLNRVAMRWNEYNQGISYEWFSRNIAHFEIIISQLDNDSGFWYTRYMSREDHESVERMFLNGARSNFTIGLDSLENGNSGISLVDRIKLHFHHKSY